MSSPTYAWELDVEELRGFNRRYGERYSRGQVVYRQGDMSSTMYVVLKGAIGFYQPGAAGEAPRRVGAAIPYGFFGELACFARAPRSVSAIVEEDDTVLLVFDREAANELFRTSRRFAAAIMRRLGERARDAEELGLPPGPRDVLQEEVARLEQAVASLKRANTTLAAANQKLTAENKTLAKEKQATSLRAEQLGEQLRQLATSTGGAAKMDISWLADEVAAAAEAAEGKPTA
jgi:CRP-like cAMP-binding protein